MPQIQNGQGLDIAIPPGQSIAISSISGTYSASLLYGTKDTLATNSDGGATFGPYASGNTVRLTAGNSSVIAYDVGSSPSAQSAPVPTYATDALGNVTGLVGPDGLPIGANLTFWRKAGRTFTKAVTAEIAKAKAGSLGHIAILGDSTAGGTGSTNTDLFSVGAQISSLLASRGIPSAGTGLVPQYRETAGSPSWSGSGWSDFGRTTNLMQGTTSRTFTSFTAGTVAVVLYAQTGGNFNVSIDGGANTLVTTNGSNAFATYTVTGLTNTTHTITITPVSTAAQIYAAEVRSTSGLRVSNFGIGGAKSSEIFSSSSYFHTLPAVVAAGCKVALIRAAVNDIGGGVATATTVANMLAGFSYLSAAGVAPALLLPCFYQNNDASVSAQATALASAAVAAGFDVFDSTSFYSGYTAANALSYANDAVHPSNTGYCGEAIAICAGW